MKTKSGISYEVKVKVWLNGKPVGYIQEVNGGFAYFANGSAPSSMLSHQSYPTIEAVMKSLEN